MRAAKYITLLAMPFIGLFAAPLLLPALSYSSLVGLGAGATASIAGASARHAYKKNSFEKVKDFIENAPSGKYIPLKDYHLNDLICDEDLGSQVTPKRGVKYYFRKNDDGNFDLCIKKGVKYIFRKNVKGKFELCIENGGINTLLKDISLSYLSTYKSKAKKANKSSLNSLESSLEYLPEDFAAAEELQRIAESKRRTQAQELAEEKKKAEAAAVTTSSSSTPTILGVSSSKIDGLIFDDDHYQIIIKSAKDIIDNIIVPLDSDKDAHNNDITTLIEILEAYKAKNPDYNFIDSNRTELEDKKI